MAALAMPQIGGQAENTEGGQRVGRFDQVPSFWGVGGGGSSLSGRFRPAPFFMLRRCNLRGTELSLA